MWADRQEGFDRKFGECLVAFRVLSAHYCHHLVSEFERVGLKLDSLLISYQLLQPYALILTPGPMSNKNPKSMRQLTTLNAGDYPAYRYERYDPRHQS